MIQNGTCPQEDELPSALVPESRPSSFNLTRLRRCSLYGFSPPYSSTLVPSALSLASLDQHCLTPLLPKGHGQLGLNAINQYGTTYAVILRNIPLTSLRLTLNFQLTFGILRKGLVSDFRFINIHTRGRRATPRWALPLSSITSIIAIVASSHR